MPKTKISEFSATPGNNTDIDGINIAEGCAPSGINDAIRELMAQLKDFQAGTAGDSFNGPVGTSTAAAGAFTTLSSTGNTTLGDASGDAVTINGATTFVNVSPTITPGTANGVTYLNGSKVLTTGSALTFDGTNFATTGSGTVKNLLLTAGTLPGAGNPSISLRSADNVVYHQSGSANTIVMLDSAQNTMQSIGATAQIWNISNAEQARLTSTGLGIGTSSPASKLEVYDSGVSAAYVASTPSTWRVAQVRNNGLVNAGNAAGIAFVGRTDVNPAGIVAINSTTGGGITSLAFLPVSGNQPFEAMRLDSSGNLGLGVTPSAWWANTKALQVGAGMAIEARTSDATVFSIGANQYIGTSATRIYLTTNVATLYEQNTGQHRWYTAPSGTAGNAISFTQAMTLDASGNLGIGTSSPAYRLQVETASATGNIVGYFRQGSGAVAAILSTTDLVGFGNGAGAGETRIYADGASGLITFRTNSTERARIDSSGNLLVGKTATIFSAAGSYVAASGKGVFTVDADEVLVLNRLTNDGNLIRFYQAGVEEGNISVSGTTVSYNGGHLSRWAQTTTAKDNTLVKGTVLSNLDEMNVYTDADGNPVENEQLNKVKVSDVEGDVNVAGVFVNWEHDDAHNVDEINMAMTGDMIIRIAQGVAVQRGDLLMSAGDGTAKPQGDDIVRSKTVAKVTSTHVTCTYADGSFCVPCVLMAC
jgi:hypothetical protein